MKWILIGVVAITLLASCQGSAVDPERSKAVAESEKIVVQSNIPEGFKVADSRRIDTNPAWVFAAYSDGTYKAQLKAFRFAGDVNDKILESPVFDAENIFFNADVEENSWGKTVEGRIMLPVSIFMGGNDWSRAYTKYFTIRDGSIVEIPVECEPGTVAGNMKEIGSELVVPVFDARFQFFNELPHAASPTREFVFKYDPSRNAFVDRTKDETAFVEGVIGETLKMADENSDYFQSQQAAMISVYIQAEAGGIADMYMPKIEEIKSRFPNEPMIAKTWGQIQDAFANKKPFAKYAPWGDEVDFRWNKMQFQEMDGS